jgi:hypothetical protein
MKTAELPHSSRLRRYGRGISYKKVDKFVKTSGTYALSIIIRKNIKIAEIDFGVKLLS